MRLAIRVIMALTIIGCGKPRDQAAGSDASSSGGRTVIQNKGSDTLVNVAQAWAEAYKDIDAGVAVAVSGGGSGTGISSMINGTVDIANASRAMKKKEIESAQANGQSPIMHVVGHDALAVFLHPSNPIDQMTIAQIRSIYAEGGTAEKWSDLGVAIGGCPSDEIVRISRQNNSGTYAYFKKAVIGKGEYKLGSRDMHGSKDVVDLVENTPCAIGFSGLAYANEHIKMPCVQTDAEGPCVGPTVATAADGTYAIARPLLMYTSGEPTGAIKQYMDWILSDAGQCIILGKGYASVRDVSCG
jgi:phosphate transport system substrate-binding protein